MTELSFLIDLLLNFKLPKAVKVKVAERIKEIEKTSGFSQQNPIMPSPPGFQQSTLSPHTTTTLTVPPHMQPNEPQPVAPIAQTAAAQAALASRQTAISEAISGRMPKGQERPRKF